MTDSLAPKRRNVVGVIAFVFGLSAFLAPAVAVIIGFAIIGRAPDLGGLDLFSVLIFAAIGGGVGCGIGLIAAILGIVSLVIPNLIRRWGIIGLVLGAIAVLTGWIPLVAFITTAGSGPTGVPING